MSEVRTFDPSHYLITVQGGAEYLEVKWRLVWFRQEHPYGRIATRVDEHDLEAGFARVSARIEVDYLMEGQVFIASGEGTGTESIDDFHDYLEKAETKAIGRALAALGYGTQFTEDFELTGKNGDLHLADAPINPRVPSHAKTPEIDTWTESRVEEEHGCEECGKELKPSRGNGSRPGMTVSEKAQLSRRKTGRVLCYDCYQDALSVE